MELQIRNFLAVERCDIDIKGIAFICGRNGEGKTSTLRSAASAAVGDACPYHLTKSTEDKPKPAFSKKDFKNFVRSGTDKATVAIVSDKGHSEINWPSGDYLTSGTPIKASYYATGIIEYVFHCYCIFCYVMVRKCVFSGFGTHFFSK